MRKVIGALNMTLDGFCDHTAVDADDEIHYHYRNLLDSAGVILYGRITYQLMEFWPTLLKNPSGNPSMDEFAIAMDKIPKVVFSHTLTRLEWKTATLATRDIPGEVQELKKQNGKDILVGSRSLIVSMINLGLLDELQLCVHPVLAGTGLPLFKGIDAQKLLKLTKTKTFGSGAILLHYEPVR